ncbi:phage Gp37/Gp68 family protein [Variovorax sp. AFSI2.2]|uniref:phage Gp37/Gp68 family protein n=1 Tax=Variovorax sp. AFSI2.2 TaxID=3384160 RepID=UPI003EB7B235
MAADTKIEWTDSTFNPWIGCTQISRGCDGCYAAVSTPARTMKVGWGAHEPRHRTSAANWALPKRWNAQATAFFAQHGRRQRVFCASLADWLDNAVDIEWLIDLLALVRLTPDIDWLMLSKRIGIWRSRLEAAAATLRGRLERASEAAVALLRWIERWLAGDVPANVWVGATVVDQPEADRDIPRLLAVPAAKRFLSMEPLLGPVNLWRVIAPHCERHPGELDADGKCPVCEGRGIWEISEPLSKDEKALIRPGIDWVIIGGESGPGARPMHPDWARDLRDQCEAHHVPFLFKQWGEWAPYDRSRADGAVFASPKSLDEPIQRFGKKLAGRLLDGREWNEVPHGAA